MKNKSWDTSCQPRPPIGLLLHPVCPLIAFKGGDYEIKREGILD